MKKFKRFAALICAILLFLMYVSTLVFAFIDKSRSLGLLKASVACTILVPVMSYAYILVYRLIHRNNRYNNCKFQRYETYTEIPQTGKISRDSGV